MVSRDRSSEPAAEDIGATQKHPPIRREGVSTHAVVRGTGEGGGGGRRLKTEELRDQDLWGRDHWGAPSSTGTPPAPHPDFQVLPAAQSRSETSGSGAPGRAESGAASQALAGARWVRAASEGSLPPTRQASPAPSKARGAAREGESTSARERAGEGVRKLC